MRKRLIITADDFGYSSGRNRGIVEGYRRGMVTRTSLLVNSVRAAEAAGLARKWGITMGLHLNLTEGYPLSDPGLIPSLVHSKTKLLLGKVGIREALKQKALCMEQIKTEISAQVKRYKEMTGQMPSYVDGHQHVHVLPGLCDVFAECGVTETRLPWEPDVTSCDWIEGPRRRFYGTVVEDCLNAREVFRKHRILTPSGYTGLSTMGKDMTLNRLIKSIQKAFDSVQHSENVQSEKETVVCELMIHPGYPTVLTDNLNLNGYGADQSDSSKLEKTVDQSDRSKDILSQSDMLALGGCGTGQCSTLPPARRPVAVNYSGGPVPFKS